MARKADDSRPDAGTEGFACVILADRGGVGKTATAALVWAALVELGIEPRLAEVEGPHERKLSALLATEGSGTPDPSVTVPTPAELAANPRLNVRTFAPVLGALVTPDKPVVLDNGATVSRGFLDAAEAADHGGQTDGGRTLRVIVVAKAEDMQSAASAQASLRRARAIYPNARIVLVVTHVLHDRQRGRHNASAVTAAVEQAGKASAVVLVPALNSPFLGELYGEQHVPFHVIAALPVDKLQAMLGDADEQETRIYRGQFLAWYNAALAALAAALDLPAPPARTVKTGRPLETAGAAA